MPEGLLHKCPQCSIAIVKGKAGLSLFDPIRYGGAIIIYNLPGSAVITRGRNFQVSTEYQNGNRWGEQNGVIAASDTFA